MVKSCTHTIRISKANLKPEQALAWGLLYAPCKHHKCMWITITLYKTLKGDVFFGVPPPKKKKRLSRPVPLSSASSSMASNNDRVRKMYTSWSCCKVWVGQLMVVLASTVLHSSKHYCLLVFIISWLVTSLRFSKRHVLPAMSLKM